MRTQRLTSLAMQAQDPSEMASLTFHSLLYPNHPYGLPEEGTIESVGRITQADLVAFHQRHYGPKGCVIAVVGGIEPQLAVEKVAAALGDWRQPAQPAPPELPAAQQPTELVRKHVSIAGKSQSDIVLGRVGPSRRDADYIAAALGNSILGQFGMYGRIGDSVREQAGLAYYAYSGLGGGRGPGPWYAIAGVAPKNVEQAIDLLRKEFLLFTHEPVRGEELADVQSNVLGRLPLSLESNGGVVSALLNLELYQLGLDYYMRYVDLVQKTGVEDVLAAARHYLDPDHLVICSAGP
jgi:zinc protease